jgi:hypothetical protein
MNFLRGATTMSRKTAKEVVLLMWTCCAIAYPFYAWITDTGLFRWFADIELTRQGNGPYTVDSRLLVFCVLVATWVIFLVAYKAVGWMAGLLPLSPATIAEVPAPAPADENKTPPADVRRLQKVMVVFFLVGSVVSIAIGVRAALIAYRKSNKVVRFEPFNLADGTPPPSTHVKLTGVAVPSLGIQFDDHNRSSYWQSYIPVLPAHWRQGDPVVYILHPMHSDYLQHSGPVTIAQPGVLIPDGLPGAAVFLFKKHGVTLGTPPMVLETDTEADLSPLLETAFWCIVFGLLVFGIFGALTVSWYRERYCPTQPIS